MATSVKKEKLPKKSSPKKSFSRPSIVPLPKSAVCSGGVRGVHWRHRIDDSSDISWESFSVICSGGDVVNFDGMGRNTVVAEMLFLLNDVLQTIDFGKEFIEINFDHEMAMLLDTERFHLIITPNTMKLVRSEPKAVESIIPTRSMISISVRSKADYSNFYEKSKDGLSWVRKE